MKDLIFRHRFYPSGCIIARLGINITTLVWAAIVLINDNALLKTPYGSFVAGYIDEDYVGAVFLLIAVFQLYRIFAELPPVKWGIGGYSLLLLTWAMVFWSFCTKWPIQPTGISMSLTVCLLAFFAVVGGPRRRPLDGPPT